MLVQSTAYQTSFIQKVWTHQSMHKPVYEIMRPIFTASRHRCTRDTWDIQTGPWGPIEFAVSHDWCWRTAILPFYLSKPRPSDVIRTSNKCAATVVHFRVMLLCSKLWPGPQVIKLFSCSTQLSMKFFLLINVKMPTIVGILRFMSRKSSIPSLSKAAKCWISWYFHTYEHLKFHAQLSWA